MRPWVRLTNAGHAMTSRIKRAATGGERRVVTTKELAKLVDRNVSTIRGWRDLGHITPKSEGKEGVEATYDLKKTTEDIKAAHAAGKIRSLPPGFDVQDR
jgi:phage terminase Nu1 subunit (DNA packaging protein)